MPTIGVLLFLSLTPQQISTEREYLLITIVFVGTYIIPLLILLILKALNLIDSFALTSIRERKIPLFIMMIIFYLLGRLLTANIAFEELGLLFFGTNLALLIVYVLFLFHIKVSLHILSMSTTIGFFLMYGSLHSIQVLPIIIILFLLTGFLASARLRLKAHTKQEVYVGFFLGMLSQFFIFYLL